MQPSLDSPEGSQAFPVSDRFRFSAQEIVVIKLAIEGLSDKEIANSENVSFTTVRTYWKRIRNKTGATNRTHAVCIALGAARSPLAIRTKLVE